MPPHAVLHISFPKPGWFLTDVLLEVDVDESSVFRGSFLSGVDMQVELSPGSHTLQTRIQLGGFRRSKRYSFEVAAASPYRSAPRLEARLRYSRFWGNFTSKLDLVET